MVNRVNKAFRKVVNAIRGRIVALLVVIIVYCFPVFAMTWIFRLTDDLSVNITISVLVMLLPILEVFSPGSIRKNAGIMCWSGLFLWLGVILLVGDKFNLPILSRNAALALVALVYFFLVWGLTGRNWLLISGLLLGLAAMMVYWVAALSNYQVFLELLFVPLPIVSFIGVIWAPLARVAFSIAVQNKDRRVAGPGSQVLVMAVLFLPVTVVAIIVPVELELGSHWSAVSLTIIGVLLSAVISEPLRHFLLEWGNLSPDPKPYQEEPQDFSGREK